ncbi:MAG: tetratricopeptide repeat protein, partial [Planctomycetaceae bacterium]
MNRHHSGSMLTVVCIGILSVPAFAADLKTAYTHLQHGRYEEAAEAALTVDGDPNQQAAAVILLSRALESQGEYAAALQGVAALLKEYPENVPVLARKAELLLATGKLKAAEATCDEALKIEAENGRVRLVQAQVFVETGRLREADTAYRWFVRMYNSRQPKDAETLLQVAAGATVYARWHSVSSIFNFVVNTLCPDAIRDNPQSWQAHYVSGNLLLE